MTDSDGAVWRSDAAFNAGGGTIAPLDYMGDLTYDYSYASETQRYAAVLARERFGFGSGLLYSIPISGNGDYMVQLLVVESWHNFNFARTFHVNVQGTRVISNVNMVADVGFRKPYFLTVPVVVTDGSSSITVQLTNAGTAQPPAIYGIVLLRDQSEMAAPTAAPTLPPAAVFDVIDRINAGPQVTDSNGAVWRSDAELSAVGGNTIRPSDYRSRLTYDFSYAPETQPYAAVLDMERYGDALSYSIPIDNYGNGLYEVQLLVVEAWHNRADRREFSVDIQGVTIFGTVNPWVDVGFRKPYLLVARVEVSDGSNAITVELNKGNLREPPAVYGIVLRRARVPTSSPTVAP